MCPTGDGTVSVSDVDTREELSWRDLLRLITAAKAELWEHIGEIRSELRFVALEDVHTIPESPGVYALSYGKRLVHTSCTANLRQRVLEHAGDNVFHGVAYCATDTAEEAAFMQQILFSNQLTRWWDPGDNFQARRR